MMYSDLLIIVTICLFYIANGFQPLSSQRIGSQSNPQILEMCLVWPTQQPQGRNNNILQILIIECQPDEICSPVPGFEAFGTGLGYNEHL